MLLIYDQCWDFSLIPNKSNHVYYKKIVDELLLFLFCKALWIKMSAKCKIVDPKHKT